MKFKNQRRKLCNDTRVAENRRKFATSRKPDDNSAADELKRHKKRKMVSEIEIMNTVDGLRNRYVYNYVHIL